MELFHDSKGYVPLLLEEDGGGGSDSGGIHNLHGSFVLWKNRSFDMESLDDMESSSSSA